MMSTIGARLLTLNLNTHQFFFYTDLSAKMASGGIILCFISGIKKLSAYQNKILFLKPEKSLIDEQYIPGNLLRLSVLSQRRT